MMSNFVVIIIRGLYPIYLGLLLVGIAHRVAGKKWNNFDSLLLASFLILELTTALMIPFFYGMLVTSKRYLWVGLPLCLPFAAEGGMWLLKHFAENKKRIPIPAIFCIAVIGVNLYNIYSPVLNEKRLTKKQLEQKVSRRVAAWVRDDWGERVSSPVLSFKCDQYQSGKRPLIQSCFDRIGYLCGGQNYRNFFADRNIAPDYIVSPFPVNDPLYVPVKMIAPVNIYKRMENLP